jgi:hypothetical protein
MSIGKITSLSKRLVHALPTRPVPSGCCRPYVGDGLLNGELESRLKKFDDMMDGATRQPT